MLKAGIGVAFACIGAYGLVWWHDALTASGIDGNRNVVQYYIPYLFFGMLLGAGFFLGAKGYKDKKK